MAVSLRDVVSFGRYEPLFRIASGGMAEVYAARIRGEAGFQKLVAIKRMHPHLATDATFVDMFLNEARLAAHIASPYVVQTLDLGRGSDGSLYIVMELVVGFSLAVFDDEESAPAPVPIALELMAQAAQGLDDAHEATTPAGDELGLIHRDVSPHNILVGIDGRCRLTDFGIARAVHAPRSETNVKELKGKFGYMSPEQTRIHPLDRRSDIFSLGVVLWEMLVGERLFAERDPSGCIRNVRKKRVMAPHELRPTIPPAVSKVVLKALERMPSARFQTGAALADALRQVGRDELGGLPRRKDIVAFVKATGGDELERLQRLIRLGTEGAHSDEIEAIRPGSTMVLGAGGSGVSRVGSRGTGIDAGEPPSIETVILPDDDEAYAQDTTTAHILQSDELFLTRGGGEDDGLRADDDRSDAARSDDDQSEAATRTYDALGLAAGAPPVARILPRRAAWLALAVLAAAAVVGAVAIGARFALGAGELPVESLPSATARTPEPRPRRIEPVPIEPAREPAEEDVPQVDDSDPGADREDPGPPAPAARGASRHRRPRAPRDAPATEEAPVLLDVNAFDRQSR